MDARTSAIVDCIVGAISEFRLYPRLRGLLNSETAVTRRGRTFVVAVGKAALSMAHIASDEIGDVEGGVIVVPTGYANSWWHPAPFGKAVDVLEAQHPIPDESSCLAAEAIASTLSGTSPNDRVIVLLSGGGSSLVGCPIPGLSPQQYRHTLARLYRSGEPIEVINAVRGGVSRLACGGLASTAAPATVSAFVLSDVPGDKLDIVASGPTSYPSPKRASQIVQAVRTYMGPEIGSLVAVRFAHPQAEAVPPTTRLVGTNRDLLGDLVTALEDQGLHVPERQRLPEGEARRVGAELANRVVQRLGPGQALVFGGETTVAVTGSGKGGRCQEFVLGAATVLQNHGVAAIVAAVGSDGRDGPTDAAGAAIRVRPVVPLDSGAVSSALLANNSYPFLDSIDALVRTGPTHTNVMDVGAIVVEPNA